MTMDLLEIDELSLFMGEEMVKGGLFGGHEVSIGGNDVEKCFLGDAQFNDIQPKIQDGEGESLDWMEAFDLSSCLGDVIGLDTIHNEADVSEEQQEIIHTLPLPGSQIIQSDSVEIADASPEERVEVQSIIGVEDLNILLNESGIDLLVELESIGTNSSESDYISDLSSEPKSEPSSPVSSSPTESRVPSLLQMHLENEIDINGSRKARSQIGQVRVRPYNKSKGRKSSKPELSEDIPLEMLSKKDRKRIQNKNAAIKYRQKKKLEEQSTVTDMDHLESRNSELHDKVDTLTREISYMKDLIKEIQKARTIRK